MAAYCRVSTDSDEQATSYEAQIEHYTAFIKKNPDWEFAGIFADDGISGTDTRKREEFNRMIEECMKGENPDGHYKVHQPFRKEYAGPPEIYPATEGQGIPVFFEKENINTMDAKGEVMLTIMASFWHSRKASH
ncbi:MAG: recombinase family protein [Blautia massiliensis (ex Durand et al. 2017)]